MTRERSSRESRRTRGGGRRATRIVAVLGTVCALALVFGSCSSDSDEDATTTTKADTTTQTTEVASGAIENAVTIKTPGMEFDVSGDLRPGIASITLVNDDDTSHMLAMTRLKDDVTLDQVKDALGKSEDDAAKLMADGPQNSVYGTPAPVGPGESSTVIAKNLLAGNYALICFFTDDKGAPHFQMGMIGMLKVTGDEATKEPTVDGTIKIDDSAITLPDGFTGHGTFLVTNSGTKQHSISFARLDGGTTLLAYYQHVGQAQNTGGVIDGGGGALVGGVDGLLPGQSAWVTLDLSTGHYGYVSITDATGPDLPALHGEFDVE